MSRIFKTIFAAVIGFSLALAVNGVAWQGPVVGGGGGGGSLGGPPSSTDNALVRWEGTTGQIVQDSLILASDVGALSGINGLSMTGLQTFVGGAAITGSSYQIGRDADATNQLHFNVPTGATFEFSVNDVRQFNLSATEALFQDNTIKTTGMTAFGDSAEVGDIPGFGYMLHSVSDTLDTQIVPGVSQYPHYWKVDVSPPSDLNGANATYMFMNNFEVNQSVGSSDPYGIEYLEALTLFYTIGGNNPSAHDGTGIGWSVNIAKDGASQLDSMVGAYVDCSNAGSTAPTSNLAWYLVSGNQGVGSTINDDTTLLLNSPYHTGNMALHKGLQIEDQEFGTASYSIKTEGGKVEFGSPSGKDQYVLLTDADVFQPFTTFGLDSKTFSFLGPISSTGGGVKVVGISDADSRPLEIDAYYGATDPTDANEAIRFTVGKANGSGGVAALGASESVLRLANNTTKLLNVLGSGNASFGANDPSYSLEVNRAIGSDATFGLLDGDVTQPVTTHQTNAFFDIKPFSSTGGGVLQTGMSDGDTAAYVVNGYIGTSSPTSTTAAVRLVGAKSNGTTGIQDLGSGDRLFEIVNNSLTSFPAFMCTGGRLCAMSTENPQARLDISSNGSDSSTQSFQVTDSGSSNTIFRIRNDAHVTVGPTGAGQNANLNVNGQNSAGGSAKLVEINSTLAAMNGSDNYTGINVNITNANHTGSSNTIYGLNINGISFDADETATAIRVGSGGWNYGLELPTNIGIKLGNANIVYGGLDVSIDAPLNLSSSLVIGNGDAISKHISLNQANVTSASISATACGDYATISVTGAAVGDSVTATPDGDSSASGIEESNLSWNAYVSATNTVTIRACNPTGSPIDNGNDQTWRIDVWKH